MLLNFRYSWRFLCHHVFEGLKFVPAQDSVQLGMHVLEVGVMTHARLQLGH